MNEIQNVRKTHNIPDFFEGREDRDGWRFAFGEEMILISPSGIAIYVCVHRHKEMLYLTQSRWNKELWLLQKMNGTKSEVPFSLVN